MFGVQMINQKAWYIDICMFISAWRADFCFLHLHQQRSELCPALSSLLPPSLPTHQKHHCQVFLQAVGSYVMRDSDTKLYEISKKHTAPSQHYALPVIFKIHTQMSCFCGLRNKHSTDSCDLNRKTYFGHEFICTG